MIKTVLVAHDLSETADRALLFATDLAAQLGAKVAVVLVVPEMSETQTELDVGIGSSGPGQKERYLRFLDEELAGAIRGVLGGESERIARHVLPGDPVRQMGALAEKIGAGIICLGATGKNAVQRAMLGSTSLAAVRGSVLPVLVVH